MRRKIIFPLFLLILAAACSSKHILPSPTAPITLPAGSAAAKSPSAPTRSHLPNVDWLTYHDNKAGFSIQRPLTWHETNARGYPVIFSLQAAPGTTLLNKAMEINVTENAVLCRETTYLSGGGASSAQNVIVNGTNFLKESGSGIAAGNIYDWTSYSTTRGVNCINLTFVLHSADGGVYFTEPAPFDETVESEVFDGLLNTFKFDQ